MARVRFYLSSPLYFTVQNLLYPLLFDGLLSAAWAKEKGLLKTPAEDDPDNILFPELPLKKISQKCYAASAMFVPAEATMYPEILIRNADYKYFFARQGTKIKSTKYIIDTTWCRSAQEKYWLMATPYIDFYFRCTNWDKLYKYLKILKTIGFIGSKRAAGFGMINKITISKDSEDYSILRNGLPTRPLPLANFSDKIPKNLSVPTGMSNYYAPYWLSCNMVMCYLPQNSQYLPQMKQSNFDMIKNILKENLIEFNQ